MLTMIALLASCLLSLLIVMPGVAAASTRTSLTVSYRSPMTPPKPPVGSALSLERQSNWVGTHSFFGITLDVTSPISPSALSLSAEVFPRQLSRYALEYRPHEAGPTQIITGLPLPAPFATGAKALITKGAVGPLSFHVATEKAGSNAKAPKVSTGHTIRLDCVASICDGVYPVEFVLQDRRTRHVLATLDTTLIYVGSTTSTQRLKVAVSFSFDLPAHVLGPGAGGIPRTLSVAEANSISNAARALHRARSEAVSVNVYGRLIKALTDSARIPKINHAASQALVELRLVSAASPNVELLRTPFAPIDLNALIQGLGLTGARSALIAQLGASDALTAQVLHASAPPTPYLSTAPLSSQSASVLGETGACDLAIIDSDLALGQGTRSTDAPLNLSNTRSACLSGGQIGAAVDSTDRRDTKNAGTDPILAAHRLVADLAQTYFEDPNASNPRAVVVAPDSSATDPAFVSELIGALRANPILEPVTLSGLFRDVPVGASGQSASVAVLNGGTRSPVSSNALSGANRLLNTVSAITPSDRNLISELTDEIYNGESFGLTSSERANYLAAPSHAIATIATSLHLSGSSHVTFTAATGKIPITIHYAGPVLPVHVDLKIKSSSIQFPAPEARQHLVLSLRDTNRSLTVSTRTSGVYTFSLELLVPNQKTVLFGPATFTITSTAASGVAVGLSLGALAVLGWWWYRSIRRRRRETLNRGRVMSASKLGATAKRSDALLEAGTSDPKTSDAESTEFKSSGEGATGVRVLETEEIAEDSSTYERATTKLERNDFDD